MVLIKAQRREYKIDNLDIVLFNGRIYKLITKDYYIDNSVIRPTLSKTKCNTWIKEKVLYLVNVEGNNKYYKFNLEKLEKSKTK